MNPVRIRKQAARAETHVPRIARRLGRPQTTSREDIIACAIAILRKDPEAGVSINGVARSLGLTPMALYTYFAGRDELLQAVSARLLESLVIEVPPGADWREKIGSWARGMRRYFLHYPYLMHILRWEGHISLAWLRQMLLVFEALEEAGLRGRAQAQAAVWVFYSIMGVIQAELSEIRAGQRFSASDFAELGTRQRQWLTAFHRYSGEEGYCDETFDYHLAQLLDGISARLRASRRAPAGTRSAKSRRAP